MVFSQNLVKATYWSQKDDGIDIVKIRGPSSYFCVYDVIWIGTVSNESI